MSHRHGSHDRLRQRNRGMHAGSQIHDHELGLCRLRGSFSEISNRPCVYRHRSAAWRRSWRGW